jgi:threonine dehydratase
VTRLPALAELEHAAHLVHRVIPPTPQIQWPLLSARVGADVWVKHENHTPTGAFKVRGGVVYLEELKQLEPNVAGVIAATRGNHGQSVAFSASRTGLRSVIVVPRKNSREKNAAMRALGAELIEHGSDFQDALEYARELAAAEQLHYMPSFHEALVRGVASYALELLGTLQRLDAVYVPIGLGSGICGMIAARAALSLETEIIGVVASRAPAYALSYDAGQAISAAVGHTIADGMACRIPDPAALDIIRAGATRVITVEEAEIEASMRYLFSDTHNAAEGAGAAAFAGLLKESGQIQGKRVAVILSGGNVDSDVFASILANNNK